MTTYRINDPRQGVIGPVRLETVRDLVSAGVIQDDVLISKDDGSWLPVGTFGELFGRPSAAGPQKATYAGDLGKNSFFKVFYRFHLAHATGLLTVKDAPRQKDIYLDDGRPVFVASNVDSERLGAFLLQRGRIDTDELEVALSAMASDHNQLGMTLTRLGIMDANEVETAIAEQQIARLIDLCLWRVGQYVFFEGARYLGERVDLKIVANDLILAAVRSVDDTSLADRLHSHMNSSVARLKHSELDSGDLHLTPTEERALLLIDGQRTVGQIIQQFSDMKSRRAASALLYLLWEIDAASFA